MMIGCNQAGQQLGCGCGFNMDEASHVAAIDESNYAVHLGKKSVVLAATDVLARLQTRAALAHDDRPASHKLSAESLYSKSLRIRVAAIFRTA